MASRARGRRLLVWAFVGWSGVACSLLSNYDVPGVAPDASVESAPTAAEAAPIAPPDSAVVVDAETPIDSGPTCTETPCVVELAAFAQSTCARTAEGDVYCWGANMTGVAGASTPADVAVPSKVTFDGPVDRIAMGGWPRDDSTGCARRGARVECWGFDGPTRLLGRGGAQAPSFVPIPAPVQGMDAATDELAVGGQLACARTGTGLSCWGEAYDGEKLHSGAEAVPTPKPIKQVVGGRSTHCVLLETEEVACAGYYQYYNPFWNDGGSGPVLQNFEIVPGVTGIRQISTQGNHVCALKAGGAVLCWGRNSRGELGRGTVSAYDGAPAAVLLPSAAKWIGTATNHSCAVLVDDTVWCWGRNGTRNGNHDTKTVARGQCGQPPGDAGLDTTAQTPRQITGLPTGGVRSVVGAYEHSCALTESGAVYCWGSNRSGQLGRGKLDGGAPDDLPHPIAERVRF